MVENLEAATLHSPSVALIQGQQRIVLTQWKLFSFALYRGFRYFSEAGFGSDV
jgi:hypothetical protein